MKGWPRAFWQLLAKITRRKGPESVRMGDTTMRSMAVRNEEIAERADTVFLPMSCFGSVTRSIKRVKEGDRAAALELWARNNSHHLLDLARARLDRASPADLNPSGNPEALANETIERLLDRLGNGRLRSIAIWKWQGYSTDEIARMLHCSSRTIVGALAQIRAIWAEEVPG